MAILGVRVYCRHNTPTEEDSDGDGKTREEDHEGPPYHSKLLLSSRHCRLLPYRQIGDRCHSWPALLLTIFSAVIVGQAEDAIKTLEREIESLKSGGSADTSDPTPPEDE